MTGVFVDTAYWLALLLRRDELHARALQWRQYLLPPFVTTWAVLFEVGDALTAPPLRPRITRFLSQITADASIAVVATDADLIREAVQLFDDRNDKDWGLTDCLSFVVMRWHGLTAALTADRHFVQAGYRALLLEEPAGR